MAEQCPGCKNLICILHIVTLF